MGEGGRKRVYLARDTRLGREVAVALIKTEGLDEVGLVRARREGAAMGHLGDHPHVVTIYDIGEEKGQLYIVSQFMAGGELATRLEQAEGHRLPVLDAVRTTIQIAKALAHAHAHGIVHRDVKPQNIWLSADGTAQLGDFGLAITADRRPLTREGTMLGTVAYMPPEQGMGRAADARSDLYSLGAVLYELVAGRPPFIGDDAVSVISQHINTPPVGPSWHAPNVPRPLEDLVLRLLAKVPADRPQSAAAVSEELASIAALIETGESEPAPEDPGLDRLGSGVFVGRSDETHELRSRLDEAVSGRGRLVMLAGESGIGKTRVATEVATYAGLRGAQVLWGRCYEGEGAPVYWPWVQVIRAYVHERDEDQLVSDMGVGAADIAQVVTEVRERLPGLPEPQALEPEQARFRLFDSIATFLRNASRRQPLAIVLDDLHSADKPSLLLLQFVAREIRDTRILLLGTYRDTDLDRHDPLTEVLAALRREHAYERILLRGLGVDEVKSMLEEISQQDLSTPDEMALVEAVHRETEGNPYFVEEVVRDLVESGALYQRGGRWVSDARRIEELGIPEGVREVIDRRVAHLPEESSGLLSIASVIGREFRLETLARVAGLPSEAVIELLEEPVRTGIVELAPGEVGRYGFSHAIIRETLYGEITASRRLALHRRTAEVLEALYRDDADQHLGELAYHFLEAAQAGDVDKAIDYARRAGARAAGLLAYEEAAGHYERALQVLEVRGGDPEPRCDLMLALGDAQWRAGDITGAKHTFERAAEPARSLGDSERFACAALGHGAGLGGFGVTDRCDETLVDLLGEALEALPVGDSPLRARVLARLAVELYYTSAHEERAALSLEAVEMADRLGDPAVRLAALYSRHWSMLGPDGLDEQLTAANEILQLARETGDREMEFRSHHFRLNTMLQRGDGAAADSEIRACARIAKELRQPLYAWQTAVFQAMRALHAGRFEEGERLAQEAARLGRGQQEITLVVYGAQTFIAQWGLGTLDDLEASARRFAGGYPESAWPAALAFLYVELERFEDAKAAIELLARNDFAALRRDGNWLGALSCLAAAVTGARDAERAEVLYDLLAPYAERCPTLVAGVVSLPPNELALAMLAATAGRWETAEAHWERTLRSAETEMPQWIVLSRRQFARLLLERGEPGDRDRALRELGAALETARELKMGRMIEQLLALKLEAQGVGPIDAKTSLDAVAESVDLSRPDLRRVVAPDGTVTVMFSDIEDSTALTERLGDRDWFELLRAHNAVVRRHLAEYDGFEVKSQGDGFMLTFADARKAVRCAVAIQRSFEEGDGERLRVRIGLHTGEAIKDRDDFFGRNVILAARIAGKARGGEILVSSVLRDLVADTDEFSFRDTREVRLKGLSGVHTVVPVGWQEALAA